LTAHFTVGKDKSLDDAIIYDYYPPAKAFADAHPGLPVIPETLILSKAGYEDTEIKVNLRYDGSYYIANP
jgi:hypothetical protein